MLRLQQCNFTVAYKAGISNPADFLSRHPIQTKHFRPNVAEDYINFVTEAAILPAFTLEDIKCATEEDKVLRGLRAAIQTGCWNCDIVNSFKSIRDEISIDTGYYYMVQGLYSQVHCNNERLRLPMKAIKELQKPKHSYVNMFGSHT